MSLLGPIIIGAIIGVIGVILKIVADRKNMSQSNDVVVIFQRIVIFANNRKENINE